jgi:hypothetical protein
MLLKSDCYYYESIYMLSSSADIGLNKKSCKIWTAKLEFIWISKRREPIRISLLTYFYIFACSSVKISVFVFIMLSFITYTNRWVRSFIPLWLSLATEFRTEIKLNFNFGWFYSLTEKFKFTWLSSNEIRFVISLSVSPKKSWIYTITIGISS